MAMRWRLLIKLLNHLLNHSLILCFVSVILLLNFIGVFLEGLHFRGQAKEFLRIHCCNVFSEIVDFEIDVPFQAEFSGVDDHTGYFHNQLV